jgi:ABC-type lipoprotein release transport system permease subunit
MIASAQTASGVEIIGINPSLEAAVFEIEKNMLEGEYLEEESRNQLILGSKLAEKLNVKLKSKVVITFTDASGQMISGGFRVAGIFNTNSPQLDEGTIFTWSGNLERILGGGKYIHEIAIRIDDQEQLENVKQQLLSRFPELKLQSWKELAPEMDLLINQSSTSLLILLAIIMLALGFGIVNTMLMAVLERMKELGMLMAVGMNKSRVFGMIILETMIIALIAGPAGLLLGFITIAYFQQQGMDLSVYAQSLESMGSASVLYPQLGIENYLIITAAVILTAVIGSLYPAWKAIRLKPVEALAKI